MNKNVRNGMNNLSIMIGYFLKCSIESIISILRICVLSSIQIAIKERSYKKCKNSSVCCVLGNGPSLKQSLLDKEVTLDGVDVFAVNMFCQSEFFFDIKPRFYFLVDGAFFSPNDDRNKELVGILTSKLNDVNWDMFLLIPSSAINGGILKTLNNPHISVLKVNTTTTDGFIWFRNAICHINMGMIRCQTVVNFALSVGIMMKYEKILLYGADHTWTRDLFVDDDNIVCYGDRHVYNTKLTVIKHTKTMSELLFAFSRMFDSHMKIRKYADKENVRIVNRTKGSFVDAYERR